MTKAIYAFSGDPITFGHIDIVGRAAGIFDELIVAIGENPQKKYTFSLAERVNLARKSLKNLKNVTVVSFKGLLVDYAYEQKIPVVVKGLRDEKDFNYEIILHQAGRSQKLGIDTLFLPATPEIAHISSSVVKELQKEHGFVDKYVPFAVKQKLEEKISGQYIVGITGEIGSGKTFIAEKFVEYAKKRKIEAHNVELDIIGHKILEELTEPIYQEARERIVKKFGIQVRSKNGMINRKKLGEVVFKNDKKLRELNAIMHDLILVRLKREIYNKKGLIILNAALFAETDMNYLFNNNVILLTVDKQTQKERLKKRNYSDDQIERRLGSQFDADEKKSILEKKIVKMGYGRIWEYNNSGKSKGYDKLFQEILEYFSIKTK
jgi:pantetheine-phosphate adenylyltransferase